MSRPFITTPQVIVGEQVAGEAAAARRSLEALISAANKSNFDIAETCHRIKARGWYHPYTTFQEFSKTLNIKTRKVQYLTRMAGVFEQVGISRSQYEPLGIARCREISSLDPTATWKNPENNQDILLSEFIKGFVEKGDTLDMDDLKRNVRTLKGYVGENDLVWINMCLKRSVRDMVWIPALDKAKALIGSVAKDDEGISQDASDGAAAEVIGINFLNDPNVQFAQLADPETEVEE